MATTIGNDGTVEIGSAAVAEIVSWSLTEGLATADDTVIGDTSDTHLPGTKNWSATISCYWDATDTTGQESMNNGDSVVIHLLPEGSTTGDVDYTGTATVTGVERGGSNNATVTANFTCTGNGDLTQGTVA